MINVRHFYSDMAAVLTNALVLSPKSCPSYTEDPPRALTSRAATALPVFSDRVTRQITLTSLSRRIVTLGIVECRK